jgi:hypothetical protein
MITLEESTELAIQHGFSGYGEQNGFYQIPVAAFHDRLNRLCNQLRDMEWKPIETAPKDGTKVLLWCRDAGCETAEWIVEKHEWWEKTSDTTQELRKEDGGYWSSENGWDATHWMPAPTAPNTERME